jgi:hypothetical protein
MDHQARDEMNITGQPVQLGDGDRTTLPARAIGGRPPFIPFGPLARASGTRWGASVLP